MVSLNMEAVIGYPGDAGFLCATATCLAPGHDKMTLCPLVFVQRQPGIKKNQNPCDCDYFKPTTVRKASPELSAEFWVTAQGSTHFMARKLTGDHNSAISVIRGRPYAESGVAATRQVVVMVNRSLRIRCVVSNCSCKRHKVRKCTQVTVFVVKPLFFCNM
jgi:hypothetical protein